MPPDNAFFYTRPIIFNGDRVDMLMQNTNGPCPLLAIANILLLRKKIKVTKYQQNKVSLESLLHVLGNYIVERNEGAARTAEESADFHQQVEDALSLLPSLARGLDVNVRFRNVTDFEFTREMSVFDMCGVTLRHGWLVDPEDEMTSFAIGSKSYNEIVEMLLVLSDEEEEEEKKESEERNENKGGEEGGGGGKEKEVLEKEEGKDSELEKVEKVEEKVEEAKEQQEEQKKQEEKEQPAEEEESAPPESKSDETKQGESEEKPKIDEAAIAAVAQDLANSLAGLSLSSAEQRALRLQKERIEERERVKTERQIKRTESQQKASIIQRFYNQSASQLTYYGLVQLYSALPLGELCVFFRNNHFSTMYKYRDELYLLETDIGFLHEPGVVWQKLSEVDGDCQFYNGEFKFFQPHTTNQERNKLVAATPAAQEAADAALAMQIQQMEYDEHKRSQRRQQQQELEDQRLALQQQNRHEAIARQQTLQQQQQQQQMYQQQQQYSQQQQQQYQAPRAAAAAQQQQPYQQQRSAAPQQQQGGGGNASVSSYRDDLRRAKHKKEKDSGCVVS